MPTDLCVRSSNPAQSKCSIDHRDKTNRLLPWHVRATRPLFTNRITRLALFTVAHTECRFSEGEPGRRKWPHPRHALSTPRERRKPYNLHRSGVSPVEIFGAHPEHIRDSNYEIRPGTLWTPEYRQTRTMVLLPSPRHFRVKPDSRSDSEKKSSSSKSPARLRNLLSLNVLRIFLFQVALSPGSPPETFEFPVPDRRVV